jgi:TonB family protein
MANSKLTGSVVVEFTLQADGRASDVTVVEATAPGVFDRTATAAVARGRFDVSVLGASRQPQRARIKLNFQP